MNMILASIGVFLVVVILLVVILLVAKNFLVPSGNVKLTINGDKELDVASGSTLLNTLSVNGVFLSSACGGKGSCGQCKCQVMEGGGEILPSETPHFSRKQIQDHWRLGCQVKVKGDMAIKVPESVLGVKEWECEVISNKNVATFIKEFIVALPKGEHMDFVPGSYAQIKIPKYSMDYDKDIDKSLIGDEYLPAWEKFGLLGEPLFLGILVGCGIGALSCKNGQELVDKIPYILGLGIKMGAVMELIPRITALFIEGLKPISDATRELIAKKFKGAVGLNIGMSPALVIGHPATLVVSLLLIPVTILLAVILPGNQFLPLASLAGMFYLFPLVLPITKGNVVKTFIIGLVVLTIGLYFVTDLAPYFTQAAHDVYEKTQDAAVNIPAGFEGGALDFASSPFAWVIFHLTYSLKWIGSGILVLCTLFLMIMNRRAIIKYQKSIKN